MCINVCIYMFKCFLCFFFLDFFPVCLFLLSCSSLFVCFCFPLFYYCSFNVCFLRRGRKNLDLDGSGGGKDLGASYERAGERPYRIVVKGPHGG